MDKDNVIPFPNPYPKHTKQSFPYITKEHSEWEDKMEAWIVEQVFKESPEIFEPGTVDDFND